MKDKEGTVISKENVSAIFNTGKFICELLEIIMIIFALSWVIRTFFLETYQVPNHSMFPTIEINEHLFLDKFFYQHLNLLDKSDIIVYKDLESINSNDEYVNRVIAMPGDRVEIRNRMTYINDKPVYEPYLRERSKTDLATIEVPEECVFVMGDNRNSSVDSVEWSIIPLENIKGKVLFSYWPID